MHNKSLAQNFFFKKKLYTFLMEDCVFIQEHINTVSKIIINLKRVENVKISDEDKAFFLLSSLPKFYESFINIMLLLGLCAL